MSQGLMAQMGAVALSAALSLIEGKSIAIDGVRRGATTLTLYYRPQVPRFNWSFMVYSIAWPRAAPC
jgi:hypothetical protein